MDSWALVRGGKSIWSNAVSARNNLKIVIEARNDLNLRRILLAFYVWGKCLKFAFKMPNLKTRLKSKVAIFWRLSIS